MVHCDRALIETARVDIEPLAERPLAFAIVASQRSGTHLLREILNSNPHIAVVAESLTRDAGPGTWHDFLQSLPRDQVPPSYDADATRLFDQYMQLVRQDCRENCGPYGGPKQSPTLVGLDVKYNQIKCVNPMFTDLRSRPFLINHFSNRRFRIVHLVRKNLLHQAISMVIANFRKVWRNYEGCTLPGRYHISVDELIGYIHWVRAERAEFERSSEDLQVHACDYEGVVDGISHIDKKGFFSEDSKTLSALADFLEVPNRFHYNHCLQKVINRPYVDIIENYNEVISAVKASEFAKFADSI